MAKGFSEHHDGTINRLEYNGGLILKDKTASTEVITVRNVSNNPIFQVYTTSANDGISYWKNASGTVKASINGNNGTAVLGGTAVASGSLLQLDSTTQGLVLPRMTTAQRNTLSAATPLSGAIIFNTDLAKLEVYQVGRGFETITSTAV